MRTAQRDQAGLATRMEGYVADAPSGSGVSSGIPYIWTRSSTGTYDFRFDTRIRAIGAVATCSDYTRVAMSGGPTYGMITISRTIGNTGVAENGGFSFAIFCQDKRS